jgi:hypothetical protein
LFVRAYPDIDMQRELAAAGHVSDGTVPWMALLALSRMLLAMPAVDSSNTPELAARASMAWTLLYAIAFNCF